MEHHKKVGLWKWSMPSWPPGGPYHMILWVAAQAVHLQECHSVHVNFESIKATTCVVNVNTQRDERYVWSTVLYGACV